MIESLKFLVSPDNYIVDLQKLSKLQDTSIHVFKMMLAQLHNKYAPYWAVSMIIMLGTGLATTWIKTGGFWNAWVIDIAGPAWSYILIRGLFTTYSNNAWRRFFSPWKTLLLILTAAYTIEMLQYFNFYPSTFDPLDFVAYSALVIPAFLIDYLIVKRSKSKEIG